MKKKCKGIGFLSGAYVQHQKAWLSRLILCVREFQATKNPSTLNQNGGVDGLHKLGTSKKSSGTSYDCPLLKKFCALQKFFHYAQT
ncbi:hypothetical protein FAI37_22375 [Enterobacter bugandensis]|nr:hypothetical protein FAI37_22375 [Enterobacter bugandensis]